MMLTTGILVAGSQDQNFLETLPKYHLKCILIELLSDNNQLKYQIASFGNRRFQNLAIAKIAPVKRS